MISRVLIRRHGIPDFHGGSLPKGSELHDVRTVEELKRHAQSWDRLYEEASPFTPMLSRPWVEAFFRHMVKKPEEWLCLLVYESGQLVGVLPLVASYALGLPGLWVQLFKLPYHMMHTSGTDALIRPGREAEVMRLFYRHLRSRRGLLPFLSLKHVPEHYPSPRLCVTGQHEGMCAVCKPAGLECYIPVSGSGAEYTAELSRKFRQNLRRAAAAFEKHSTPSFVFDDQARPVADLFDLFLEVEDHCWKGERCSSIKALPESAALMRDAAQSLSEQGKMVFSFLEDDDRPVATHYALCSGRTLYILKMGYDDTCVDCSPGNLLMHKVIEASFDSGKYDEINLFSNPPHLARWNVQRRPIFHLIVFPRIPLLSGLIHRIIDSGRIHNFNMPH